MCRIADQDWRVHVNHVGPRPPPTIAALEAAGVKLVIDHFGWPGTRKGVARKGFQALVRRPMGAAPGSSCRAAIARSRRRRQSTTRVSC